MSGGDDKSRAVRPTCRCLEDDLGIAIPSLNQPLHEVEHPVVKSAQQVPARHADRSAERIRDLTDRVWLKDRAGQWRSAVTQLRPSDRSDLTASWWIGAAGLRRSDHGEPYATWVRRAEGQVGWSALLEPDVQCHLLDEYPDDVDLD